MFDFSCNGIYSKLVSLDDTATADDVVDRIASLVDEAIAKTGIDKGRVIGMGVAAPGKVAVEDGIVIYYGKIDGLVNYHLKEALEKRTGLDVHVHNNCSAMAYGLYNDRGSAAGSIFTFLLRSGVTGSLVDSNGIYIASDGTTLEAGHIIVKPDGLPCTCGMCGCLQAQLLDLDSRYCDGGQQGRCLFENLPSGEEGEKLIGEICDYLYVAVKDIQRFSSPESFLIICSSVFTAERIAEKLRLRLESEKDFFTPKAPNVKAVGYDTSLALKGAMELVLSGFFNDTL